MTAMTVAAGVPTAVSADLLAPPSRAVTGCLAGLVAGLGALVVWAGLAHVEEVAPARGRVIPASRIQVVQNLEGGIVREMLVREGQAVKEGDVVVRIDPTHFDSTLGEAREKVSGLQALIARLEAEAEGREPVFPDEVTAARGDLVGEQKSLYLARKRELQSTLSALSQQHDQKRQEMRETEAKIGALERAHAITSEERNIMRPLERSQSVSRTEVLQIEAKLNDLAGSLEGARLALPRLEAALREIADKRSERENAFRSDVLQKLAQSRIELRALQEQTRGHADRVSRTLVRAPVSGVVKTVNVTTPGQVVQPGSALIEIVPANDTLLVEAQVRPQDIAFIRPGATALVKITAYDFSIYGGLEGRVEQIGADSVTPEKGEPYYPVRVRTTASALTKGGEVLPIIPGMVAEVDVKTGSKTVLQYLTKPLTRVSQQALRER